MERTADERTAGEQPAAALVRMLRGYWLSEAIVAAARLGLADFVAAGPRSYDALAAETGVPAASLARLVRALASVGIFTETAEGVAPTPMAALLRSDVPGSLRSFAIVNGDLIMPAWSRLLESLASGRPSFAQTFGTDFFSYLGEHPELGAHFQQMMAGLNARANAAVPVAYDFSGMRRVVDIGGGNGSLLAAALLANPAARGVLFDLPQVLDQARAYLEAAGVADRCELVGGDFFAEVPSGGDCYLLRWILHDFDDERAVRILRSCRAAIAPEGRLLVLEHIVSDDPEAWATKFLDLQMLILLGGQERTEAEFGALFATAGFALQRVIATDSPLSILEAIPTGSP